MANYLQGAAQFGLDTGENLLAGGAGLADAATFGLLGKIEAFQKLKDANPIAYGAGEVASVFIPASGILRAGLLAKKGVSSANVIRELITAARAMKPQEVKKVAQLAKGVVAESKIGDLAVKKGLKAATMPTALLNEGGEIAAQAARRLAEKGTANKYVLSGIEGAANAVTQATGQGAIRSLLGTRQPESDDAAAAYGGAAAGFGLGVMSPALQRAGKSIYGMRGLGGAYKSAKDSDAFIQEMMDRGLWGGRSKLLGAAEQSKQKYVDTVNELLANAKSKTKEINLPGRFGEGGFFKEKFRTDAKDLWVPFLQQAEIKGRMGGDVVPFSHPKFSEGKTTMIPRAHRDLMEGHLTPGQMNLYKGLDAEGINIDDVKDATHEVNILLRKKRDDAIRHNQPIQGEFPQAAEDFKKAADVWEESVVRNSDGEDAVQRLKDARKEYGFGATLEGTIDRNAHSLNAIDIANQPKSALSYGVARAAQRDMIPLTSAGLVSSFDIATKSPAVQTFVGLGLHKAGANQGVKRLGGRISEKINRKQLTPDLLDAIANGDITYDEAMGISKGEE